MMKTWGRLTRSGIEAMKPTVWAMSSGWSQSRVCFGPSSHTLAPDRDQRVVQRSLPVWEWWAPTWGGQP